MSGAAQGTRYGVQRQSGGVVFPTEMYQNELPRAPRRHAAGKFRRRVVGQVAAVAQDPLLQRVGL